MKYGFMLRPSGSMNFADFMEGMLLIVSMGFAPGGISTVFMAQLYSSKAFSLYVPVWIRYNRGPFGTRLFETLVEIKKADNWGRNAGVLVAGEAKVVTLYQSDYGPL